MLIPVHCCLAILRPDSLLAVHAAQYVKQGLKTFDRSSDGFTAERCTGSIYQSTAPGVSSKCGQRHADSR